MIPLALNLSWLWACDSAGFYQYEVVDAVVQQQGCTSAVDFTTLSPALEGDVISFEVDEEAQVATLLHCNTTLRSDCSPQSFEGGDVEATFDAEVALADTLAWLAQLRYPTGDTGGCPHMDVALSIDVRSYDASRMDGGIGMLWSFPDEPACRAWDNALIVETGEGVDGCEVEVELAGESL